MAKEKTIQDYNTLVSKTKQRYLNDQINYSWKYTFKEEDETAYSYFMIVNHHQATKILFDKVSGTLINKDMYTMDVKTMIELQGTL